jgi:hypothetical protein
LNFNHSFSSPPSSSSKLPWQWHKKKQSVSEQDDKQQKAKHQSHMVV